jgi:hypothetical protein
MSREVKLSLALCLPIGQLTGSSKVSMPSLSITRLRSAPPGITQSKNSPPSQGA